MSLRLNQRTVALVSALGALWTCGVAAAQSVAVEESVQAQINAYFADYLVTPFYRVLFWDLCFWDNGAPQETKLPAIVAWLASAALFFTFRMGFISLRAVRHAVDVVRGRFDDEGDPGDVSHFQALSSALSATVGLGNISGVAIAITLGGPGATFWMIVAGFLGMTSKFVECSLGQMYRTFDDHGHVLGGPMRYLDVGLAEIGRPRLGRVLAIAFTLMCIGGSFGGGNMYQANQAFSMVHSVVPAMPGWLFGLIMATIVGAVIIGGIERIGSVAAVVVPMMCGVYVVACVVVVGSNAAVIPAALAKIVIEAFSPQAGLGGAVGVLVVGFQRAAFSNEAGVGSASIAHSAAATDEPIREGLVALLEPFIDTIVICTMTALVVVVSGLYGSGEKDGIRLTSAAFASVIPWFPYVLSVAVFFFAYSTMISWSYYGERCWTMLFGPNSSLTYKLTFLVFTALGPILQLGAVLDFSDLMILGMALPNLIGAILLSGKVRARLDDYWGRYTSGEMKRTK